MALIGTLGTHEILNDNTEAFLHDLQRLTQLYGIKFNGYIEPLTTSEGDYLLSYDSFATDPYLRRILWREKNKSVVAKKTEGQEKGGN